MGFQLQKNIVIKTQHCTENVCVYYMMLYHNLGNNIWQTGKDTPHSNLQTMVRVSQTTGH